MIQGNIGPSKLERLAFSEAVAVDAAKTKALINFLMQDRFFLEHFRSDDPTVRAAAMDTLNKAHHEAYGDAPAADDDAASGRR